MVDLDKCLCGASCAGIYYRLYDTFIRLVSLVSQDERFIGETNALERAS